MQTLKNSFLFILKWIMIPGLLLGAGLVLWPRTYAVQPLLTADQTSFWELPTGSKIAYFYLPPANKSGKETLLYLHGGPGGYIRPQHLADFSVFSDEGYPVYLYDQLGGGRSNRLDDINGYTVQRHVADLKAIIDQLETEVVLVGQSWGALLATQFVLEHPGLVKKIIFTNPGPILPIRHSLKEQEPPKSIHLIPPVYRNEMANRECQNIRTRVMFRWAWMFGKKLASDIEADAFASYLNEHMNQSTLCKSAKVEEISSGIGYYNQVMTLKSFSTIPDKRAALETLDLPVLVLKGQCDNQPWGYTAEYLKYFKRSQFVLIEGAGHAASIERPVEYKEALMHFLREE